MDFPALALLEFDSIAAGIQAGDAMVKKALVSQIIAGTVQPGHFLIMIAGDVAAVEEATAAGKEIGQSALQDMVYLPNVHPAVIAGIQGQQQKIKQEAIGVIETKTAATAILAADAGLKGAEVSLLQLRLADGLGGKGLALFAGNLTDIEAAIDIAGNLTHAQLQRQIIIPQIHPEMAENIDTPRFGQHFSWEVLV